MAELSVEEAQRLARQFLTGRANPAELGRLQGALPEDQTLALELLTQMQTALDDVVPEPLSREQSQSVDSRVEALLAPRVRRRGVLSLFKRLFRRSPRPTVEAKPRRPAPVPERLAAPPEALVTVASEADLPDAGMEEMAPIVPAAVTFTAPAREAPSDAATPEPAASATGEGFPFLAVVLAVVTLLLVGAVAWQAWRWFARGPAPAPPVAKAALAAPTAVPSPVPPAAPLVVARPVAVHRAAIPASASVEPLPASLPPTTPQAAGQLP